MRNNLINEIVNLRDHQYIFLRVYLEKLRDREAVDGGWSEGGVVCGWDQKQG